MEHPVTILIVEDNRDNLELFTKMLESSGFSVISVLNAEEALQSISVMHTDVMLIDIRLPGYNGFELLALLRNKPEFDVIRTIAITASTGAASRTACIDAGFDAYLTKPISRAELANAVTLVLDGSALH